MEMERGVFDNQMKYSKTVQAELDGKVKAYHADLQELNTTII